VGKARLVRRWQALDATAASQQLLERSGFASAAGNDPSHTWTPAYTLVNGTLPLDAIPGLRLPDPNSKETRTMGLVRWQLDVSTAGRVKLLLNSTEGIQFWADDTVAEAKPEMVLNLSAGLHTLTVALDLGRRREGLRCELEDVPGSPARARVVGGK
jgi:hypothetical protein